MPKDKTKQKLTLSNLPDRLIAWVGTGQSLIIHTFLFVFAFVAHWIFGWTFDIILLVLTTIVSLEAIYLAIFIQRSVNQQATRLDDVEESLDDVEESLDDVEENLDDVEESIDAVEESLTSNNHKIIISDQKKLEKTLAQIVTELQALRSKIEK